MFENVATAIQILISDGLSWQETILGGVALAALVLIVWIICTSLTKIAEAILNACKAVLDIFVHMLYGLGRALKDLTGSAAQSMVSKETEPDPHRPK